MPVGRMNGAQHVGILFFYLMLTLAMTYPLVAHLTDGVLGPPGDNFEYPYKLWWFKRAAFDLGVSPFFNPNVFYPEGYHLALHEMSLANVSLGMPLTILYGEISTYNALVLLSFVLSGFGAYLLVLRLTGERLAALVSGVLFAFCSYRMAHLGAGHLNLLGTQWLPFLFICLDQLLEKDRLLAAILCGVFYALSALSSWYYAPLVAVFAAAYVLWRGRPWRLRPLGSRLWRLLAVSAAVAGLLMAPSIAYTAQQWSQRGMAFSLREVDVFSASIRDFVVPNAMHPLWGRQVSSYYLGRQDVPEYMIGLSWLAMALALAGLWPRHRAVKPSLMEAHRSTNVLHKDRTGPNRDWMSPPYALLLALSVILALGTTLHVGGQRVYLAVPAWMERGFTAVMGVLANRLALHPMPSYYDLRVAGMVYVPLPTLLGYLYVPFFDAMRVWTRFGMISAFAVAVLAGIGLARVMRSVSLRLVRRPRSPRPKGWRDVATRLQHPKLVIACLCLVAVLFELVVAPYPLGWSEVRAQPVDLWLARQIDKGAVIQLPLWKAESGPGLYASTVHGKPIVYGYGPFFPRRYRELRPVLWDLPTEQAVDLLRDRGVRYVLVGSESYGAQWPDIESRIRQLDALHPVATFAEQPVYHSGWLAESQPDFGRAFVVDQVHVYELR